MKRRFQNTNISAVVLFISALFLSGCSSNDMEKQYSYKSIDWVAKSIKRDDELAILTNYGVYCDDYQLSPFDSEIDSILKSKSLKKLRDNVPGLDSIKASGNVAFAAIRALNKDDNVVIVVMSYNTFSKKLSFVSAEECYELRSFLNAPEDLMMDRSDFLPRVRSKKDGLWQVRSAFRATPRKTRKSIMDLSISCIRRPTVKKSK